MIERNVMKRNALLGLSVLLLLLVSCTTEAFDFGEEEGTLGDGSGSGGGSQSDPTIPAESGDLLDFTVAFDENDESTYGSMTETVSSDEDDFIENSEFTSVVTITYNGTAVTVNNNVSGVEVSANGGHVVVNSTVGKVEYVLSGTTTDGSFKVYSEKKFKLSLSGVSILNPVGAAINIQSSKRVFVVCADGTTNALTDGSSYTSAIDGEDMKACFFSEGQLIFSGSGSLTVTGNYKHAITSDDYVRFRSGCNITVAAAKKDGVHANDAVIIGGGILNISSTEDAIQCEEGGITMTGGFVKVSTTANKAHGLKSEQDVLISGGAIQAAVAGAASKGISCDGNLTFSGGKLTALTSQTALYEDNDLSSCAGIKCDGNMLVTGGEIAIQSTGGAGKGINCDGSVTISDGTVKVITTGPQCTYNRLSSSAKGIKADGALTIDGGTVLVKATGGEGSEGIESKSVLTINNGMVAALCYDDCINASNSIVINGGNIYCYSSGNDGIDSNGTLTITGGVVVSSGTTVPEDGLDCDQNTFKITGGIVLGIGGGTSTPTSSVCTQRSVIYGGSGSNGQYLNIRSTDGTDILTYQIPRAYSQMTVLFSSPNLTSGGSYIISKGGTVTGGSEFFGLYTGATYSGGTQAETFTASSMVTQVGSTSGGGGGGGGRPGGGGGPGGWGW